jgi:predicted metalloendopeptidase
LKEYIKWNLLNSATSLLSTPIEMASFDFMAKLNRAIATDQDKRTERYKRLMLLWGSLEIVCREKIPC